MMLAATVCLPTTIMATGTAKRKLNAIVQPTTKQMKNNSFRILSTISFRVRLDSN